MAERPGHLGQPVRRAPGDPALRTRDERLEALKAVVGKLAHDFNNFLMPQFGYLTLLSEELPADTPAAQYLKTMEAAARTTEGYIESVLLAMRPQRQYAPKDLELDKLLIEAVDECVARIPSRTAVRVERVIEPAPVHGDERHWRKALEHLLSNARLALATGGTMRVALRAANLPPEEAARLGLDSGEAYGLQVQDSGFGIPEPALSRVFEPFYTTRAQSRGSGLGLTIIHTVAHFYGGQVELTSREDEGATITLWIPRTAAPNAGPVVKSLLREKPAKKRKVLLVEDDPVIEQVLRGWLSALNLDVQLADTPAAALKILARDPAGISLVITETTLKDGRGEEVASATSQTPGLACIFLTEEGILKDAPVIRKPISKRTFTETVLKFVRT